MTKELLYKNGEYTVLRAVNSTNFSLPNPRVTAEGFNIGGTNLSEILQMLPSIDGIPITLIEERAKTPYVLSLRHDRPEFDLVYDLKRRAFVLKDITRSVAAYRYPQLLEHEQLVGVMVQDNDAVQATLIQDAAVRRPLTHRDLAIAMVYPDLASKWYKETTGEELPEGVIFEFNGQLIQATYTEDQLLEPKAFSPDFILLRKNPPMNPFDGTKFNIEWNVVRRNISTGESINYFPDSSRLINRYGFYCGPGTVFRVDPLSTARIFGFVV